MLRFIASSVSVLICTSFLYLEKPQSTSAPHKPGSGAKVAIPQIEPRPEDVSTIDGMVRAYYEVVSGPAEKKREWGRDRTLYIPDIRFLIFREDKDGRTSIRTLTHQEFVDESEAAMAGKAFYEREVHRIAHRAGDVVHVLSTAEQKYSPDGPVEGLRLTALRCIGTARVGGSPMQTSGKSKRRRIRCLPNFCPDSAPASRCRSSD